MKKTPLQEVVERFGSKEQLVKELKELFDQGKLFENKLNPDKGLRLSNAKLLKLHQVATEVKERFTTREKLLEDLSKMLRKAKDEDFKARLGRWGLPRLWDYYQSVQKKHESGEKSA